MSENDLKSMLRRLLRVRGEILMENETVPAELDAKIDEVVGKIEAWRQTIVIEKNQTQRPLPTPLSET